MAAAEAFTAYARGGRPHVPWAPLVVVRMGGLQVARFDGTAADRPKSWQRCPGASPTYEGRDCPVSPLSTMARASRRGRAVVYETEPPRILGCNRYPRTVAGAATTIWIRPDTDHRDCFSDFAVAVSLDRAGAVASVDFALSGP